MALDKTEKEAFLASIQQKEVKALAALKTYESLDDIWDKSLADVYSQRIAFGKKLSNRTDIAELEEMKKAWIKEVSGKEEWQSAMKKAGWQQKGESWARVAPKVASKPKSGPSNNPFDELEPKKAGLNPFDEEEPAVENKTTTSQSLNPFDEPESEPVVITQAPPKKRIPPPPPPRPQVETKGPNVDIKGSDAAVADELAELDDGFGRAGPTPHAGSKRGSFSDAGASSSSSSSSSLSPPATPSSQSSFPFDFSFGQGPELDSKVTPGFGKGYTQTTDKDVVRQSIAKMESLLQKWGEYYEENDLEKGPGLALSNAFQDLKSDPSEKNFNAFFAAIHAIEEAQEGFVGPIEQEIIDLKNEAQVLMERLHDAMTPQRLNGYIEQVKKYLKEYEKVLPEIEDEAQRKLIEKNIKDLRAVLDSPTGTVSGSFYNTFIQDLKGLNRDRWDNNAVLYLVNLVLKHQNNVGLAKKGKKGPSVGAASLDVEENVKILLNKRADKIRERFLLRELGEAEKQNEVYKRGVNPPPIAKGAWRLLSRFEGAQPKDMVRPEDRLHRGMAKDLKLIKDVYVDELKKMHKQVKGKRNKTPEDAQNEVALNTLIQELEGREISVGEFQDLLDQMEPDERGPREYLNAQMAAIFTPLYSAAEYGQLSETAKNAISEVSKQIYNKIAIQNAPKANQSFLKQLVDHQKTIEKALAKQYARQDAIEAQPPREGKDEALDAVGAEIALLAKEKKAINDMFALLTNPEAGTLARSIVEMRAFLQDKQAHKADYPKGNTLDKIVDAMLKKSDPYYDEIKRLDKYIADITKEAGHPTSADYALKTAKGKIALAVRNSLLPPELRTAEFGAPSEPEIRTGATKLTVEVLQEDIRINRGLKDKDKQEPSFLGKIHPGRLDGILQDILKKKEKGIEPAIQTSQFKADKPTRHRP